MVQLMSRPRDAVESHDGSSHVLSSSAQFSKDLMTRSGRPGRLGFEVSNGNLDHGMWYEESMRRRPATEMPDESSSARIRAIAIERRPPRDQPASRREGQDICLAYRRKE